jgi:hypothetical protein
MKLIHQDPESQGELGLCLRACLASLFEVEIDSMPAFEAMEKPEFHRAVREWVSSMGYDLVVGNGHLLI